MCFGGYRIGGGKLISGQSCHELLEISSLDSKQFLISTRNTQGTLNFQPRVHKFDILFTPAPNATVENPSGNNLFLYYKETIRFYGPDGIPCTGIDGNATGHLSYPGFPDLPVANFEVSPFKLF